MPEFYHAASATPAAEGKRHVFVATPATSIEAAHFASVVRSFPRVMAMGVALDHFLLAHCCHVDDARNICVKWFLKSSCSDLLFIDADVGFQPEGLYRICEHAGEIVAGVYPRKEIARSYPMTVDGDSVSADENGLITAGVASVPAGFLRISRKVIERMADVNLAQSFRSPESGGEDVVPVIFERRTINGLRQSGDVAFCQRARDLGYPIIVDALQAFIHEGPARFTGCLAADLGQKQGETAQ